jgi:putative DNA primase/helicase
LYGIELTRGIGQCPFPENHNHGDSNPSLRYDRKRNRLFCASQKCLGEKGVDAIGLVQRMDRCSFQRAVEKLSNHYGVHTGNRQTSHRRNDASRSGKPGGSFNEEEKIPAEKVRQGLSRRGFPAVAEFAYGDCLQKVRFENSSERQEGKDRAEKEFRWEHLINGVWYSGDGGLPKPLYVNRIFQERDQIGLALGLEGEAKADLAGELGIVAFSFKDLTVEQAMTLADGEVVLWPDKDGSGQAQAVKAAQIISEAGAARSVKLLTPPPDLPEGADIVDAVRQLGWDASQVRQFTATATPYSHSDIPDESHASGGEQRSGTNSRSAAFRLIEDAVIHVGLHRDDDEFRICGRLEVIALTRDEKGENWGRLLRWLDAEGRVHEWAMPMSLLTGDGSEYRARLLDGGLVISPGRKARELLTTYIQTAHTDIRSLCVSRSGWHGDAFVLPGLTVGQNAGGSVLFQTTFESDHYIKVSGTLDDWREKVGRLCQGNSRLILSVSCAFAGPVLSLLESESGGTHFHGPTSVGKSTALIVGGSVCGGGGRNGFVRSWRTTANGLEAIAELHNDLSLFLDELAQTDAREVADIVYLLGNGSGKTRMSRGITTRKHLSWTVLYVSSGELTLAEHALAGGRRIKGGAEVRQLNIEADAGAGMGIFEDLHNAPSADAFARQLSDSARRFYGTPLQAFLELIVNDKPTAVRRLQAHRDCFLAKTIPANCSGEVSRAAHRFAVIAAAGELATEWGLTGWRRGEANKAAERCFHEWVKARGTKGASDIEAAIGQVRSFLGANGASRFQFLDPVQPDSAAERIINRAGFKRLNSDGQTEYLILQETFRSEICAGYSYAAVLRELDKRGFLVREHPNMTVKPRLPELGSIRVYCIRASILEGDE